MSEIELILEKLRIVSEEEERGMYLCDKEHSKLLLDYITNLQKEKENQAHTIKTLLEENEELHTRIKTIKRRRKAQTSKMRKYREEITNKQNSIVDYKSRNEKAIEYIKENGIIDLNGYDLLNILQGEDNNE